MNKEVSLADLFNPDTIRDIFQEAQEEAMKVCTTRDEAFMAGVYATTKIFQFAFAKIVAADLDTLTDAV